ncbi:MAG: peptidoglycan DD-metalloendopeptidase family protein [Muribaculaceae bacterium]|nr:peptidoglycan DD-metalloendopeptidase family protein [Muribaculaceae bacterium]
MNRIKTLFLTLAVIATTTSATKADELSALVAAVAASIDTLQISGDVKGRGFENKQTYRPRTVKKDISLDYLDGLLKSMNRQALQSLRRDDYDFDYGQDGFFQPTLGRQDFFRPVTGIITSKFGWRPQFQRVHHGVDLSLNIGDTVRAAISGTVKQISYDANGYGHYVVMAHPDGMETVYGHLQYALVSQGQFVSAGQPLAIGGNTGNSTGPHLHFETRLGGVAVDPMLLFDFYGTVYWHEDTPATAVKTTKGPTYSHQSKSLKKENTYIVRYGDTLESIARQAGISVMRLCQLNMLSESAPLPIGRMIKLK